MGVIGCGQIFLRKCGEVGMDRGGRKEGSRTFEKEKGFFLVENERIFCNVHAPRVLGLVMN